jgi:hypothetical protein
MADTPLDKSWVKIASDYGVATALALLLAWWMVTKQDEALGRLETSLAAHSQVSTTASAAFVSFSEEQRTQTSTLIALVRQVCINTAKTDTQRRECVR